MEDPSVYYDKPLKTQKHPHYEHRGAKLYKKNNEFSDKNFQRVRRVSNKKKLVNSLRRIGKCRYPNPRPSKGLLHFNQ